VIAAWRRKRRIGRLPQLRRDLAEAENRWLGVILRLDEHASPELRVTAERFREETRRHLGIAEHYLEELERSGTIADEGFVGWFDRAQPFANLSLTRASLGVD
jgi:hypothetical protein